MSCATNGSPFSYIRITPTACHPWVAVGSASPSFTAGITACSGLSSGVIFGTPTVVDPITGCTRSLTCVGVNTAYVNQCTVINWPAQTNDLVADSTALASINLACLSNGAPVVRTNITPDSIGNQFGCCTSGTTGFTSLDPACFVTGDISGCSSILSCNGASSSSGTTVTPPSVDGVMQFITQICGSNTNISQSPSSASPYGVYSFRIQRPTFPVSYDCEDPNAGLTCFSSNPWAQFFKSNVNPIIGYGNYNPLTFTIGSCFNSGNNPIGPCAQLVTLIYIGAQCQTDCAGFSTEVLPNGSPLLECQGDCSGNTAYYYPYYYANILFSLTDASGNLRRCKSKYGANCYLKVAPYGTGISGAGYFCVYFAQTRSCGGVNQIIVNTIVDLACLLYGGTVYIVTAAKTLYALV